MITACGRPVDFTDRIIAKLQEYVQPSDILIHLGDVIFKHDERLKPILDGIAGTKVLIIGNHDRKSRNWYCRNGFSFASDMLVLGDVLLSHRPVPIVPSWIRLNVHGHLHNKPRPKRKRNRRYRLLALEFTNYCPVKFSEFAR